MDFFILHYKKNKTAGITELTKFKRVKFSINFEESLYFKGIIEG